MTAIQFQIFGDEEVVRDMLAIGVKADNASPALLMVAEQMREAMDKRFEAEGYGEWAPLKPATVARKAAEGLDPRILHATLAMRESLSEEGGDNFSIVTDDTLFFGSSIRPYPAIHQRGGDVIPKRKVMDFREIEIRNFGRTIQAFLVGADAEMIARAGAMG